MTTRRQTSRANGPELTHSISTSAHPTFTLDNTLAGIITREPLGVGVDPISNSSIAPSQDNRSNILERHPKSRFTLNRILIGVIPFAFVVSKFIDRYFNGAPLTVNLLDFILAILIFILYWCSLYEGDPPPRLRWLLDTNWDYMFDVSKRCAVTMKNNPLEIWCVLVLVYSALAFVGKIARQSWMCQKDCDVLWTFFVESFSLVYLVLNVVFTISGVSKHRAHAYKKFSIIVIGVLFQIGSLIMRTFTFSSVDGEYLAIVAGWVSLLGGFIVFYIGRTANLLRSKLVFSSILLFALGGWVSFVAWSASKRLIYYYDDWAVWMIQFFVVLCAICILIVTGILILTLFTDFLLDSIE